MAGVKQLEDRRSQMLSFQSMGLAFSRVGNINGRRAFIPFVAIEGFLFGPTAGSQAHERLVNHNARNPGPELGIESKLRELCKGLEQGILGHVLRIRLVPDDR